ncbi:MAG: hypothetical protein HY738_02720 [Bacteroidia bacterium]|nr:hypothetical protein [Bacteroidia bacterium]
MEPGTVTFSATTEARTEMPMKLEPGKTYYLKCTISMGVLIGRPDLNFVPESIGVTETTKLKNK